MYSYHSTLIHLHVLFCHAKELKTTKMGIGIMREQAGPVRGESRSEARGNISFESPIGPENTSGGGGGGGVPLEIGPPGPLLYLGARGK